MKLLQIKVNADKPMMIVGGSKYIDEEYAKDFYFPISSETYNPQS